MKRHIWQFHLGFLICCVMGVVFFGFSPGNVQGIVAKSPAGEDSPVAVATMTPGEPDYLYLPVIFANFSPEFEIILVPEDLTISSLAAGTADRWIMNLIAGDTITITVAPGNSADITLSVVDVDGMHLVDQQNLSPAGEVETITDLSITKTGEHELFVQTVQGEPTDYALMFLDQESYSFVFRGTLHDNDLREDSLPEDVDHFWFFNAAAGQSVSFTITPDSNSDAYVEVYDPEGSMMLTIDDTGDGEPESLEDYPLLDSGLYGIRVAEFDFREMDYQISISLP